MYNYKIGVMAFFAEENNEKQRDGVYDCSESASYFVGKSGFELKLMDTRSLWLSPVQAH